MKNQLIVIGLIALMLAGCAGITVRDTVLLPVVAQVYENVYPSIILGLEAGMNSGEISPEKAAALMFEADKLRDALRMGAREGIIEIDWVALEPWAKRGVQSLIDNGTISPMIATPLLQRIVNFRQALEQLGIKVTFAKVNTMPIYSTTETIGGRPVYIGEQYPLQMNWTPLERHNAPRRALGMPELTWEDLSEK
jgi:hypothetical protein